MSLDYTRRSAPTEWREVEEALKSGGNAAALRRKAVAAYEKAEAEGRAEEASAWNDLLNRWEDLTMEVI